MLANGLNHRAQVATYTICCRNAFLGPDWICLAEPKQRAAYEAIPIRETARFMKRPRRCAASARPAARAPPAATPPCRQARLGVVADSFDHLISAQQYRWGYGKAERRGGLAVHDHLEFCRELHREIARPSRRAECDPRRWPRDERCLPGRLHRRASRRLRQRQIANRPPVRCFEPPPM